MLCGTHIIMWNISHIQYGQWNILRSIVSPQNIIMDLNDAMYASIIWLLFFIKDFYSIGVWLGEKTTKTKYHKDTCLKEIGLHMQILLRTSNSMVNKMGSMYIFHTPSSMTSDGE